MANVYGQFYGYTGLFPIIEEARSESHAEELRGVLAALPNGRESLFSRTGLVHGARLFIVDDVVYNGEPAREEHLAYSYLAMSVTFDGDLPGLAERVSAVAGDEFKSVFSHCYGFGGAITSKAVLYYLRACQIETTFLYVDVDNVNLQNTLRALEAQRLIADLVEQAQELDDSARKALVAALAARLTKLKPPTPGGFSLDRGGLS